MDNKKVRAWIYYDWANSAFATTMMAAVLPIFYVDTAALTLGDPDLALSYWGFTIRIRKQTRGSSCGFYYCCGLVVCFLASIV
jgi:MFS-type transporter involved in bile tolerance (Atg22 family)